MLPKRSLDPEQRTLYSANLQPPAGHVFDGGVATTFSLDFETALAVPVSLALFAAENRDDILAHPLALLEGAERIAGRLLMFTDAGHIQAHVQPSSRLCSLLERIIVEVAAPKGGAFHPKIWALRFKSVQSDEPARLRLLVLSRNLTRDRSWDIALTLDGVVIGRPKAANRPLADLLRRLPELATAGVPEGASELVDDIAEDVRRTKWSLPDPFQSIAFAVNGLGGKQWRPGRCRRLGVISLFCDDEALSMLANLASDEKPNFIGRSDELIAVPRAVLDRFGHVAVLDEMAATEDGEEGDANTLRDLHAKAFIAETGWDTAITVGSGNATRPALLSGSNVELFATLIGKRSRVGSIDEILGDRGFGRLTRAFVANELATADPARRAAEKRLDAARREICRSGLLLRCERDQPADGSMLWRIWLIPPAALSLAGISALRVWLITRGESHGQDVLHKLLLGQPVDLGAMPLADLTRFLACQLTDIDGDDSILFSTGLVVDGLPSERYAAILRWVINSKDAFFRYLRLLLSELDDPFAAALAAQEDSSHGAWRMAQDDAPLLEEMVRAFCRGGEQLRAIERLIVRLEAVEVGELNPIPAEFRTLWETFRTALNAQEGAHVE